MRGWSPRGMQYTAGPAAARRSGRCRRPGRRFNQAMRAVCTLRAPGGARAAPCLECEVQLRDAGVVQAVQDVALVPYVIDDLWGSAWDDGGPKVRPAAAQPAARARRPPHPLDVTRCHRAPRSRHAPHHARRRTTCDATSSRAHLVAHDEALVNHLYSILAAVRAVAREDDCREAALPQPPQHVEVSDRQLQPAGEAGAGGAGGVGGAPRA